MNTHLKHLMVFTSLLLCSSISFAQQPFITTWKTDNPGTSNDDQITIPTFGSGYNYTVDWGDGNSDTNVSGDITHTYATAGNYTVSISGDFPRIFFSNDGDKDKILTVEQWGDISWEDMGSAFWGASNLTITAADEPNLAAVTNMASMFRDASSLTGDLSNWDVSTIENMDFLFLNAGVFNSDLGNWDVSSVTTMRSTFNNADAFNQPIGSWDVSSVADMNNMFSKTALFNKDIGNWDVSNVINFQAMFDQSRAFNQDLSNWDLASAENIAVMFGRTEAFNGNIQNWDVSNVSNFTAVFLNAESFDQDISVWNVGNATGMNSMFEGAALFDYDLSSWDVSFVTDMDEMFNRSGLSKSNYDKILDGWSQLTLQNDVVFGASEIEYCNGAEARQSIIDNFNWTITDAGEVCNAFVTTWKTDNPGTSNDDQITIPTTGTGYDYTVDWGDGTSDVNVTGDITHTYAAAGTYTVSISGDFPRIYFNDSGDSEKILTIEQWGDIAWESMQNAFFGCTNLNSTASDAPDLTAVTSLFGMFSQASSFNANIDHWDVSNIDQMGSTFFEAVSFNQPLNSWDVSKVINMNNLFNGATSFDQDLSNWDVGNVAVFAAMFLDTQFDQDVSMWDVSSGVSFQSMFRSTPFNQDISNWNTSMAGSMSAMFRAATSFNQNLTGWDVSNVTDMSLMFAQAVAFNGDISDWDVSAVGNMNAMLFNAVSFDQDLGSWDVSSVFNMSDMLDLSGLSTTNYDNLLEGWSQLTLLNGVAFGVDGTSYCTGGAARQSIIDTYGWNITDSGENCIVNIPDANFKAALLANSAINTVDDGEITIQEAEAYTGIIEVISADVEDVTGLEAFTNFTVLNVNANPALSTIDVSQNTALVHLEFANCNVSEIDLSNNPDLLLFRGANNNFTSVDVSHNPALLEVSLGDNALTAIDLSNNPDLTNIFLRDNNLTSIDVSNNPDLEILFLDNNDLSTIDLSGNPLIERLTLPGNSLTALDLSNQTRLTEVLVGNNLLTELDLGTNEDLTLVDFRDNNLSIVDFSGVPGLQTIQGSNNELTTLDVSQLPTLLNLDVQSNELDAIDLSGNTNLQTIQISGNNLTTIDFSSNTSLVDIWVSGNQLTSLDVSNNIAITRLLADDNQLASIDLSANSALVQLQVRNNNLSSLSIANGNNANFTQFEADGNPNLTCITVDDVAFAEANFTNVDAAANFSLNCSNDATDILTFSLVEQVSPAAIDMENHAIEITLNGGTDVSSLVPTFTLSEGATSNPASGAAIDFSGPVTIAVTAENPSIAQDWTVEVSVENSAPIVANPIADQSQEAGFGSFTIALDDVFSDADGDALTYGASSSNTAVVTVATDGSALTISEVATGSATITVTADDGVGGTTSDAFEVMVTEAPLGFEDEISLDVYPNPATSAIYIKSTELLNIDLTDLKGRILKVGTGRELQMDLQDVAPGIYLLKITYQGSSTTQKIVKVN